MSGWGCGEVVERSTDYIEGALRADDHDRMVRHLHGCEACEAYLGEVRVTLLLLSGMPTEPVSDQLELNLLARYRERTASISL